MRLSIKNVIMQFGRFGSMAKTEIFFGGWLHWFDGREKPAGNLRNKRGPPALVSQQNTPSRANSEAV